MTFVLLALNYFPVVLHHVCMAFYGYSPPYECRPHRFTPVRYAHPQKASSAMTSYSLIDVNATLGAAVWSGGDDVIFRRCDAVVTSESGANESARCEPGEFHYGVPDEERTVVMEVNLAASPARAHRQISQSVSVHSNVMLDARAREHTHTHTHTHAHARTHARTHTRTHARTHAHTHTL